MEVNNSLIRGVRAWALVIILILLMFIWGGLLLWHDVYLIREGLMPFGQGMTWRAWAAIAIWIMDAAIIVTVFHDSLPDYVEDDHGQQTC